MAIEKDVLMKNVWHLILYTVLAGTAVSCVRESLFEDPASGSGEDFNIEAFSEGYSVAFDMLLDRMGGGYETRADGIDDARIEEWENYVNPEEFRILFFDAEDHFLFESKTRWFTSVASYDGGSRWRVGVPIFSYLSDSYDENISTSTDYSVDESYNWDRIMEIMRANPFKVAILANRPSDIVVPELSDLAAADRTVASFGKNGPFWSPKNSVASYTDAELQDHWDDIKTVFDLHHCQYDPFYENKNKGGDPYGFLFEYENETMDDGTVKSVPFMGAVSSWFHPERVRNYTDDKGNEKVRYFYRLPESQILGVNNNDDDANPIAKNQYIPMYGIQQFDALTTWAKGSTYNLSQQTGSQIGNYDYKSISLLRSIVKLELRIPWYDKDGGEITVNNEWAQICASHPLARCEPMDTWTPTNKLWKDHKTSCEWLDIRDYGLYTDFSSDYTRKLSWFFGAWKEKGWDFSSINDMPDETDAAVPAYPHLFNPITQRMQIVFITDCYLPVPGKYHRWIIYCGEKNMSDPNALSSLSSDAFSIYFRIQVTRPRQNPQIYYLPVTDYSAKDVYGNSNPAKKYLTHTGTCCTHVEEEEITYIEKYPEHMNDYCNEIRDLAHQENYIDKYKAIFPYPLLRNHMYRLTVSFGNGDDIDVKMIDGEKRVVGGIEFN